MESVFQARYIEQAGHYVVTTGGELSKYEAECEAARLNGMPLPKPKNKPGRIAKYGENMEKITIHVKTYQKDWLYNHENASEIIRKLIDDAINSESKTG